MARKLALSVSRVLCKKSIDRVAGCGVAFRRFPAFNHLHTRRKFDNSPRCHVRMAGVAAHQDQKGDVAIGYNTFENFVQQSATKHGSSEGRPIVPEFTPVAVTSEWRCQIYSVTRRQSLPIMTHDR
jgi:hypothetical protein